MDEELKYMLAKQKRMMGYARSDSEIAQMYRDFYEVDKAVHDFVAMNRCLSHYKRAAEQSAAHYDAARDILMQILTPQMKLTLDEKGLPVWRTTNT